MLFSHLVCEKVILTKKSLQSKNITNTLLMLDMAFLAFFKRAGGPVFPLSVLLSVLTANLSFIFCYDLREGVSVVSDYTQQFLPRKDMPLFLIVFVKSVHKIRLKPPRVHVLSLRVC